MVVSYYRWISAVKAPTLTRRTKTRLVRIGEIGSVRGGRFSHPRTLQNHHKIIRVASLDVFLAPGPYYWPWPLCHRKHGSLADARRRKKNKAQGWRLFLVIVFGLGPHARARARDLHAKKRKTLYMVFLYMLTFTIGRFTDRSPILVRMYILNFILFPISYFLFAGFCK